MVPMCDRFVWRTMRVAHQLGVFVRKQSSLKISQRIL